MCRSGIYALLLGSVMLTTASASTNRLEEKVSSPKRDEQSNTTSSTASHSYEYDAKGRLVKILNGTTTLVQYTYDKAGNRQQVSHNKQ